MKRTWRLLSILGLGLAAACGGGGGDGDGGSGGGGFPVDGDPQPSQTHVLIEVVDPADLAAIEAETGVRIEEAIEGTSYYLVRLSPQTTVDQFIEAVGEDVRIVDVERDEGVEFPEGGGGTMPLFSDDPMGVVGIQTEIVRIGGLAARERTTGAGVVVAVVDTGADASHPLLAGRLVPGWDFVDGDEDPADEGNRLDDDGDGLVDEGVGHGTFVASLVLAVAPDARVMPLRALGSDSTGTASSIAKAIAFAVASGADVVNLSAGLPEDLAMIQEAIQSAWAANVPVFAAAGNRMSKVDFPALLSQAEAVTAVDAYDRKATWASYGTSVDLSAPGVGLLGAHPRSPSGVARWSGTSFSTALSTGGYALVRSLLPLAPPRDLVRRIEETAVDVDVRNGAFANRIGKGRIDLDALTRLPE